MVIRYLKNKPDFDRIGERVLSNTQKNAVLVCLHHSWVPSRKKKYQLYPCPFTSNFNYSSTIHTCLYVTSHGSVSVSVTVNARSRRVFMFTAESSDARVTTFCDAQPCSICKCNYGAFIFAKGRGRERKRKRKAGLTCSRSSSSLCEAREENTNVTTLTPVPPRSDSEKRRRKEEKKGREIAGQNGLSLQ